MSIKESKVGIFSGIVSGLLWLLVELDLIIGEFERVVITRTEH